LFKFLKIFLKNINVIHWSSTNFCFSPIPCSRFNWWEHCRLRLKAVCHVPALILTNANDKRRRVHLSYLQRMISHASSCEAARIVRDPVFNLRIERRISFVRRLNGKLYPVPMASNIDKVSGYRRRTRFSRGPCWTNGAATEH